MTKIIGIVSRSGKDSDNYSIFYVNNNIVKALLKEDASPFLILPTQAIDYEEKSPSYIPRLNDLEKERLNSILKICDGIVIPGGSKWYQYDEYICKYAIDNDIPLLCICAGMQLLVKVLNNDKLNGYDNTILNDTYINHNLKMNYVHEVNILENTFLYEIIGKTKIMVNSRHNYHVPNELSYFASAYSLDGLIEAVEYRDNKFALGIQWHPESMIDYDEDARKIIKKFVKSTKNRS